MAARTGTVAGLVQGHQIIGSCHHPGSSRHSCQRQSRCHGGTQLWDGLCGTQRHLQTLCGSCITHCLALHRSHRVRRRSVEGNEVGIQMGDYIINGLTWKRQLAFHQARQRTIFIHSFIYILHICIHIYIHIHIFYSITAWLRRGSTEELGDSSGRIAGRSSGFADWCDGRECQH